MNAPLSPPPPARFDIAQLRTRLANGGAAQWRSLEQLADLPHFRAFMAAEFPSVARLAQGPDRRRFLQLMAASLALAGLTGCDDEKPDGHSQEVPFVRNPEHQEPGVSYAYASVVELDGMANGVLVTCRDGRPLKIEGNSQHPWSLGGTDAFGQASVLGLYDPFRSQSVRFLDRPSTWEAFRGAMVGRIGALRAGGGRGFWVLTGAVSSPSLLAQLAAMQAAFPAMRIASHVPAGRQGAYAGSVAAFGQRLETQYRFDAADVVVSLDGDLLDPGPWQVGQSRRFIDARREAAAQGRLLALHDASSIPSLTSAKADYVLAADPSRLIAIAERLGGGGDAGDAAEQAWTARAAAALAAARGRGIVTVGATASTALQAAQHRLNDQFGNLGRTVLHMPAVLPERAGLAELAAAIDGGEVELLLMLGVNPVYDAPVDFDFTARLAKVAMKVHAGSHVDETALRSNWHLPLTHALESWGDARSPDGTVGLMQPTISPLYSGRSPAEVLSLLTDAEPRDGRSMLAAFWQASLPGDRWPAALQQGFVAGTASPPITPVLAAGEAAAPPAASPAPSPAPGGAGLSLIFRPDASLWDGRFAANAWLQELPRPLTKIVWDNVITIAPALAERMKIGHEDQVAVGVEGRVITGHAWIMPGQAPHAIGVTLGYGRTDAGEVADNAGYNAYAVRQSGSLWRADNVELKRVGEPNGRLATTQAHNTMEGHDLVRVQQIGAAPVGDNTAFTQPTLYDGPDESRVVHGDGVAWGMVIDLDACIGCNACVTACQSENNIAVVGPEEVRLGREMHWLRVDRYYSGAVDEPATHFQPVPCMMCEQAPCEVGCPVEATLHDHQGLNQMVYNRCVGTRACSGYCPYKVRRFNYYDYSAGAAPSVQEQRNPSVTVRSRGVMEKCTYCVQRIAEVRITTDKEERPIRDGEVVTACQGACPTRAISFGDLGDRSSAVTRARADGRNYALLGELNARPRTTYLAEFAPPAAADGVKIGGIKRSGA